jgi:photosystem II stability/assembly factor-like uncharacterized protein
MDEPMGAAAVASEMMVVMAHLVDLLYSYGRSTSGIRARAANRPRRRALGTMVTARERFDEALERARVGEQHSWPQAKAALPEGSPTVAAGTRSFGHVSMAAAAAAFSLSLSSSLLLAEASWSPSSSPSSSSSLLVESCEAGRSISDSRRTWPRPFSGSAVADMVHG